MSEYRLRRAARDDLELIWDYTVEEWGADQAEAYLLSIMNCFEELSKNPEMGRKREDLRAMTRSFPKEQHVIFYEVIDADIEILAVVHQSADIDRYFSAND